MESEKKRLAELALRARGPACAYTRFLEPPMEAYARRAADEAGVQIAFSGGYPDAERRIAAFFSTGGEPDPFPIRRLMLSWNARYASPGHRDILGALMGLGVARETLGDIVLLPDKAVLFAHRDVAGYLIASLESAGRARLRVAECAGDFALPEPQGTPIYRTASAARLDAVLAAAWNLSRREAQDLICQGQVKVNHLLQTRPNARLDADDLISARGLGRLRLQEISGPTRKGRLGMRLLVYGK